MTAEEILRLTAARPPTLGPGRLVCVDGPAGAGKTTLAARLATSSGGRTVHLDDLYPGWEGLGQVDPGVLGLLEPLSRGVAGRYRRYDWVEGRFAEEQVVPPSPLLVLEGVGAGNRAWAQWVTTLVWVEAPYDLRLRRGLERDGDAFAPHWRRWAEQEQELFAEQGTRERADVVVSGVPHN